MLSVNISNPQYVVSLDSLDLCLLDQYIQQPINEKKVLLSKSLMDGESTYCEIQMASDDIQDEDSYIEPSEIYMCHICNIDVPQLYFKQHNKSIQHQRFKKLAEKALQNVLKQINIDVDAISSCTEHDKYYCETCSKVILVTNKHHHNRSRYHLKAIEKQKLAVNFIEKYLEDNEEYNTESETDWNFDSDSESDSDTNLNQIIRNNNVLSTISETPNKNTECSSSNAGTSRLCKTPETPKENAGSSSAHTTTTSKATESTATSNKNAGYNSSSPLNTNKDIINFKTYLKQMMVKHKLNFDMPITESNYVLVVTPQGYVEKISVDAFHGYEVDVTNGTFCFSCRQVANPNKTEHSKSRNHLTNIMKPIDDNFTRGTASGEVWRYCLICNIAVIDVCTHIKRKKYDKVETPKEQKPIAAFDNIKNKKYCDVCERYIAKKKFTIHVQSNNHKKKLVKNNSTVNNSLVAPVVNVVPSNIVLTNIIPSISSQSRKDTYCDICNVNIPLGGMGTHVKGKPHKAKCRINVRNATVEGIRTELSELELDNSLRNDLPSTSNGNTGTLTSRKMKSLARAKLLDECKKHFTNLSNTQIKCFVCKLNVPNNANNIITHVKGVKHKNALDLVLDQNKILKIPDGYYCQICHIYLDDFIVHITQQCKLLASTARPVL